MGLKELHEQRLASAKGERAEPRIGGDAEMERMLAEAPLLERVQCDTGETGRESGGVVYFGKCPVCGHDDCFRYYGKTNSWCCYSDSCGEIGGGTYLEYLKAVDGLDDVEAVKRLREVTGHPYERNRKRAAVARTCTDEWSAPPLELVTRANGKPENSLINHIRVLESDPAIEGRIVRDEFSGVIQVSEPLPWDSAKGFTPRPLNDADYLEARAYIETRYHFGTNAESKDAVLAVANRNRYDAVRDCLEALEWDGTPRVGTLLSKYLGAEDAPYTREVERLMFSAVVERTYGAGAKFDVMPVLIGGQGLGKSTFARLLALRDEWFTDDIGDLDGDKAPERLRGHIVVELAELNAIVNSRKQEGVKAFLTRQSDNFRVPYARHPEKVPRRCVLIGTTNNPQFLSDMTGNRRFFPVACGVTKPRGDLFADGARRDFEQAYAEVCAARAEGGTLSLVPREEAVTHAAVLAEEAMYDNPKVGKIGDYLEARLQRNQRLTCALQIAEECLGIENPKRNETNEVRDIMRKHYPEWKDLGNKKQRVGGYGTQRAYRYEGGEA